MRKTIKKVSVAEFARENINQKGEWGLKRRYLTKYDMTNFNEFTLSGCFPSPSVESGRYRV